MRFHLTPRSTNRKTGPIPVSTSPIKTCPDTCPFKEKGCYANGGPLRLHWDKISRGERGVSWDEFLEQIAALPEGQIWRHNQAGDLVGDGKYIDLLKSIQLCEANQGRKGYTYTHYRVDGKERVSTYNRRVVRKMNKAGFAVNLSANNPEHAEALLFADCGPVTTMLPSDTSVRTTKTPNGHRITVCPAFHHEDITCEKCKLCARPNRKSIIGFPAHGFQKRFVEEQL